MSAPAAVVGQSIATALSDAARVLSDAGIDTPALDARLLLGRALAADQAALIRRSHELLDDHALARFDELVARRAGREPVSRILGEREFYGRVFALAPETLDPRPDTETLVNAVLARCARHHGRGRRILDLGTGSGAIIVTLLAEMPDASGIGVDVSPGAVATARENARRHGVSERCGFVAGDWASALSGEFDLIVANPPYIPAAEIGALPPEVRDHDPLAALFGGPHGLDGHRAVAAAAARMLEQSRGMVAIEIGAGQEDAACSLLRARGLAVDPASDVERDLAGLSRVVIARHPPARESQKKLGNNEQNR